jgi:hypothetical protein
MVVACAPCNFWRMDEEAHSNRLIGDLLVYGGMLMEDESVVLIRRLPHDAAEVKARLDRFQRVAADLNSLATAATAVWRLRNE